jgi:hypothetical protein
MPGLVCRAVAMSRGTSSKRIYYNTMVFDLQIESVGKTLNMPNQVLIRTSKESLLAVSVREQRRSGSQL